MRPKIYLLGDSITEDSFEDGGWGASLANHFSRTGDLDSGFDWLYEIFGTLCYLFDVQVDVVLRGYSGYNTRWVLKVLDKVFHAVEGGDGFEPLAVTVFFGANDACLPDRCSAFQHVPLEEYKRNLLSVISSLKKRWSKTQIILITPPPIDEETRLRFPFIENPLGLPERTNEAAGAYAKACIAVAKECGIPVVDLWTRMQQVPDWQNACLRDGLHLSRGGNRIVFEEVVMKLKDEGLSLEVLPVDLPLLANIDPSDPLKAFQQY
ncbi:hypothetical protein CJ030_MR2G011234 [Morella rubra]|uniref:Uncharacterized protein n=1 Tax=Morella rubra TaxID=262757 RepID=A0A6A1WEC8_9ROSI|nr:hypothetical protein CJ030_MR2G011234 [Morella rubra]